MKRKIYLTAFFLLISIIAFAKVKQTQQTPLVPSDDIKYFDANGINMSVRNNGKFADINYQSLSSTSGLAYKNIQFIYTSGLWLAATVDSDVRASAVAFYSDFTPGAIGNDGLHYGENDSVLFRVYKINRGDTPETNPDYADWPAQLGAPVDVNGNPKILGDQTLWCSFSDAYLPGREFNLPPALNAEVHLTVWGWQDMENIVFLRWEIINKSDKTWQDAYFGFYVDPDVADANDDLVASDSTLNLVYTYETKPQPIYAAMQSIGYVFLQTPLEYSAGDTAVSVFGEIVNYKNVPAASPLAYKHTPWEWTEIAFVTDTTSQSVYNRLRCIDNYGNPMINPVSGERTYWGLSGDPITETGWLDPLPQDRRMMLSSGPFDLASGDTNSAVLAIVPVVESHNKTSIYNLKQTTLALHSFFREGAGLYSKRIIAASGQRDVEFPIYCVNQTEIKEMNFTIPDLPEDLQFVSASVGSRCENFSLTTQTDPQTGAVSISLRSDGNFLVSGKGEIARLYFDVYSGAQSGTYPVPIGDITFIDKDDQERSIPDFMGAIEVRELPAAPTLLTPAPGQFIDGMKVDFSWSEVPLGDTLVYKLKILGEAVARAQTDTNFAPIPTHDFVYGESRPDTVYWYVEVCGPDYSVYSADTSYFILPSAQQLKIVKYKQTWTFPTSLENESIRYVDIHSPYVYVLAGAQDANYDWTFEFHMASFSDNDFQLINSQQLTVAPGYVSLFTVNNDRVFLIGDDKIFCYSIDENSQLQFISAYYFGTDFVTLKIAGDNLYLLNGTKLSVLNISDLSNITLLSSVDVSDWLEPGESVWYFYRDRMEIAGDHLFMALGVHWGIFDITHPESPNLLVKFETPAVASAIALENEKVYVGTLNNWLGFYDVSSPENPQLIHAEYFGHSDYPSQPYDRIEAIESIEGYIYLRQYPIEQACHFEEGKYFLMDGYYKYDDGIIVKAEKIFDIHRRENTIDVYENRVITTIAERKNIVPEKFALFQNYPNPFNPETEIRYQLPQKSDVELVIYNIQGQKVKTLFSGQQAAGTHRVKWNGLDENGNVVASGVYLCQMRAGKFAKARKMLLLR